ncbi:hypothetical protein GCM10007852_06370 [Agaribacter marinus]|uniref:Hemolysin-type calcium-binding repeat-containing protein n=2 Tax=Agaribacter marinus TaxID=1431249 RepID=A0AA37SWM4_9ALTE|nr:hypothetical protein GCM10007852_06370 [Agaribacter marinus]
MFMKCFTGRKQLNNKLIPFFILSSYTSFISAEEIAEFPTDSPYIIAESLTPYENGVSQIEHPVHTSNDHVTYAVTQMANTGAELYGAHFTDNPDSMQFDFVNGIVTTWDSVEHNIEGVDFLSFGNRGIEIGDSVHFTPLSQSALVAAVGHSITPIAGAPTSQEPVHTSNDHVTYVVTQMANTGAELYGAHFTDNPDSMQFDFVNGIVTTWDSVEHNIEGVDFLSFGNRDIEIGDSVHFTPLSESALVAAIGHSITVIAGAPTPEEPISEDPPVDDPPADEPPAHTSNDHVTYAVTQMANTGAELYGAHFTDSPDSMQFDFVNGLVTTWDGIEHSIDGVDFLSFGNRGIEIGDSVHFTPLSERALVAAVGHNITTIAGAPTLQDPPINEPPNTENPPGNIAHDLSNNVLMVGHSLVGITMPDMLNSALDTLSADGHINYHVINGAPLKYNWLSSHQAQGVDARAVLPQGNIDVLVLTEAVPLINHTTWSQSSTYAANFYNLAVDSNPDVQVYMYETWHSIDSGTGVDVPYDDNDDIPWRDRLDQELSRWEGIVDNVNAQREDDEPYMHIIPAGQAMAAMHDAIEMGQVPGVSHISDLFSDDIHLNDLGNYFLTMVQYATIYGRNPDNLPEATFNEWGGSYQAPSEELADSMQAIAWEAVTNYARSGVFPSEDTGDDPVHNSNEHVTYAVTQMGNTGAELYGAHFTDNPDSMQFDFVNNIVITWDGAEHSIEGVDFLSFGNSGIALGTSEHFTPISVAALAASIGHNITEIEGAPTPEEPLVGIYLLESQADRAEGLINPSLAYNLSGINDWTSAQPFIDFMKTGRTWFADPPWSPDGSSLPQLRFDDLEQQGYLDENGWPIEIPEGYAGISTFFAWGDFEASVESRLGTYVLTYEGEGTVELSWGMNILSQQEGRIEFQYVDNNFSVNITDTDPNNIGDYIRNISIVRSEHEALYNAGEVFNPDWLNIIEDAVQIRFMDWMNTNSSEIREWSERTSPDNFTYAMKAGAPVEIMVALANKIGADPWFTLPYHASDEYVREFAKYVYENLDTRLKANFELSNEVWNWAFSQAQDQNQQAQQEWGAESWAGYYVKEATNMALILDDIYGDVADTQLVKVLGGFVTSPWLTSRLITAEEWFTHEPDSAIAPFEVFDSYAVTSYFGGSFVHDENLRSDLLNAIQDSNIDEFSYIHDSLLDPATSNSIPEVAALLAEQKALVDQYGMDLILYEGGQHIHHSFNAGLSEEELASLQGFLTDFVRSPEMANLYQELWNVWRALGDGPFMQFTALGNQSIWGSWGLYNSIDDTNPRAEMLQNLNIATAGWWNDAGGEQYQQGITELGTHGDDEMIGTSQEDTLLGGDGNDLIVGGKGDDTLFGDAGDDTILIGPGKDIANGGSGADTFVFSAFDSKVDTILEFETGLGGDVLDLSHVLSDFDASTDDIQQYIVITENSGDAQVLINIDGQGDGFMPIANIDGGVLDLSIGDLITNGNLVVNVSAGMSIR